MYFGVMIAIGTFIIWDMIITVISAPSVSYVTVLSSSLENEYDTRFLDGALSMIANWYLPVHSA